MNRIVYRLTLGVSAMLLLCLSLAIPPARAGATPHRQAASSIAPGAAGNARTSSLSRIANLEGSVNAVAVSGALAYAVAGHSLLVIDISNPTQPSKLATLALQGGDIYNLQIAAERAYLTSIDGVLRIVDIHDPQRPMLLSTYDLGLAQLQVVGDLAYAIVQGGRLGVFDVGNPLDVRQVSSYVPAAAFFATDLQVAGGLAFVASYDSGFQIIDLRDLSRPHLLGRLFDRYFTGISLNGNRAYLARQTDGGQTYLDVIDVSQPAKPKRLASLPTRPLRDLQAAGSLVYGLGDNGLYIIDVSKPAAPRQIGVHALDSYPALYAQLSALAIVDKLVYVAAGDNGLQIIDAANPALPTLRGRYVTIGATNDVQVIGNLAYVAAGSYMRIFNVGDPAHPILLGSYAFRYEIAPEILRPVGAFGLQIRGKVAYAFSNFVPTSCCLIGMIKIIDISDPAHPIEQGTFTNGGINDIQIIDQRVYLTSAYRLQPAPVLSIVDATNPISPTLIGTYGGTYFESDFGDTNGAAAVDVAGSLAYVADYDAGLKIIDVSNPVSPALRSRLDTPGSASDIQVVGSYAYIADGERGLLIVDISNPNAPVARGSWPTPERAVGVRVADSLAYVAIVSGGVQVIDVADPARPIPRARYDTPGLAQRIEVAGDTIFVADEGEGLQILKLAPLPSVSAAIPPSGGTLASPADGISYTFAAGTFASTTVVTHTTHFADAIPPTGNLAGSQAFDLQARDSATGQPVQPTKPYSVTIQYGEAQRGPAIESTLALYFWDGSQWVKEPSSTLDITSHTISATPNDFALWAVLGETRRAFLPLGRR